VADFLEIDGSYGEGGGQILRTAAALSIVTQRPIRVFNIRAKREKPGLQTQHLEGLKAAAELCNGKLVGAKIGSTEISFAPGKISKGGIRIEIPTAGSIGLILQVLQLACSKAPFPIEIEVRGGADFGKFAPPLLYLKNVILPYLSKMGYESELHTLKSGFYPKGGADTKIILRPPDLPELLPLNLVDQGSAESISISGVSVAANQLKERRVAERQAAAAAEQIKKKFGKEPKIETRYVEAENPGSGIVLWIRTESGAILGSDSVGELKVTAERVGQQAARELIEDFETGACVDRHAADQLLPYMALAGKSAIKVAQITPHVETNIWAIEKFLPAKFAVDRKERIISV